MKVYRIECDFEHYQYLLMENDDPAEFDRLVLCCKPQLSGWRPPAVFSYKPLLRAGDFWQLGMGGAGGIMATPEALQNSWVEFHLRRAGELLPVPFDGRQFMLINVLECISTLDQERSRVTKPIKNDAGQIVQMPLSSKDRKYVFHRRFSESSIFTIPETCFANDLLTWERDGDPEAEFKAAVEEAGLMGLIFEELWSSDS